MHIVHLNKFVTSLYISWCHRTLTQLYMRKFMWNVIWLECCKERQPPSGHDKFCKTLPFFSISEVVLCKISETIMEYKDCYLFTVFSKYVDHYELSKMIFGF